MLIPYAGGGGSSASHGSWRTNWIGLQFTDAHMFSPMISMATKPNINEATPSEAEIDRSDLCVADPVRASAKNPAGRSAFQMPRRQGDAHVHRATQLNAGEDILIFGHRYPPRSWVNAPDRKIEPPAPPFRPATRPERPADDDADRAPERRRDREEQAKAMDAEGADRVADACRGKTCSRAPPTSPSRPSAGLAADRTSEPCRARASALVKKKLTASMCAGL